MEFEHIPKDCELSAMGTYCDRLSVCTFKDGRCFILKNNNKILVPENERNEMLGLAHAENHKGPEGMVTQLRGKVFWPWMGKQVHKMVDRCEPCQRLARSNVQEDVEIRHNKLFNTHPGHTLHVDYFEINNRNFLIMVDRLTGFAKCEMTVNKGTDAAITAIKNWGDQYGFPYKIIADGGPAFREDFIKKLTNLNINHFPSSAYHSQSNSLAKCGVLSVKNCIKKSAEKFTAMHLNEMIFAIK